MGVLCAPACSVMHCGTCHTMAHGTEFPRSVQEMVWCGEQPCRAVHCWSFSINIPMWKGVRRSTVFSWSWEASRKLVCVVSRLALVQNHIRERNVQYSEKRKGNPVSSGSPFSPHMICRWSKGNTARRGLMMSHLMLLPLGHISSLSFPPSTPKAWKWCFFSHSLLKHWRRRFGKPKFLIWSNSPWELIEYSTFFSFQPFYCCIPSPNLQSFSDYMTPLWLYPMINAGLITLSGECWCKGVTAAGCAPVNDMFPSVWRANYCVPHLLRNSCSKERQSIRLCLQEQSVFCL